VRIKDPRSTNDEAEADIHKSLWEERESSQDFFSGIFSMELDGICLSQAETVHNVKRYVASGEYFSTLGVSPAAEVCSRLRTTARMSGCRGIELGFGQDQSAATENAVGKHALPWTIIFQRDSRERRFRIFRLEVGNKLDVLLRFVAAEIFDGLEPAKRPLLVVANVAGAVG